MTREDISILTAFHLYVPSGKTEPNSRPEHQDTLSSTASNNLKISTKEPVALAGRATNVLERAQFYVNLLM